MIMFRIAILGLDKQPRPAARRPGDGEPARHAEMHNQALAAGEASNQIFSAPVELFDPLPRKARSKAVRKGETQVRPPRLH